MRMGLKLVYTGNGKGKTTAALGLALRAVGHGYNVVIASPLKTMTYKGEYVGEYKAIRNYLSDKVRVFHLTASKSPLDVLIEALEYAKENKPFLLILDEINNAVASGVIELEFLSKALDELPEGINVVLTGRGVHEAIIRKADLVSRIDCLMHYIEKGLIGVKGLDW